MGTIQLTPDFKEFLKLLNAHEVRYLVIGGYALNAFGYVRNIDDIDIWIGSEPKNQERTVQAIRVFGFSNVHVRILDAQNAMLRTGVPPLRIEVLKTIDGIAFDECWLRRVAVHDSDPSIFMMSREDFMKNKLASGRKIDAIDADELS